MSAPTTCPGWAVLFICKYSSMHYASYDYGVVFQNPLSMEIRVSSDLLITLLQIACSSSITAKYALLNIHSED